MADKREIGSQGSLTIGTTDYDLTSVSYSLDADISETQFNSGFTQNIVTTGVSYSGSFEHSGSNKELQEAVRDSAGIPKVVDQLTIKENERTVVFRHVLVGSRSKDLPADDRTSESYDFVAEKVNIKDPGA